MKKTFKKTYPKYNGEKLDPISRARMDKIQQIIEAYFITMGVNIEKHKNFPGNYMTTHCYNIAFEILTTK